MQGRKIKGNVLDVRPQWRVRSRWANATDSPSPPTLDNALIHLCSGLQQKSYLIFVNFYRFNAKNWHFRQILREKVAFFFFLQI